MNRRAFIGLTSCALANAPAVADSAPISGRYDGSWWTTLTTPIKIGYVIGYADGSERADSNWAYGQYQTLVSEKYTAALQKANDYSGVTFGQLIDDIDKFYKDFKNTRIHAEDAMVVVKQQISGYSQEEVEKTLMGFRKMALDPRY